jgi:Na+-translocating ferredoxin:NAD+ oxidoreductase RnfE subunit
MLRIIGPHMPTQCRLPKRPIVRAAIISSMNMLVSDYFFEIIFLAIFLPENFNVIS